MLETAQIIATAIGVALIALEYAWGRWRGRHGYPLGDSFCNAVIAVSTIAFGTVMVLQGVDVHRWLDGHALVSLPTGEPWVWLLALVAVDFVFYWGHRAMHRLNLLWTVHAVHHQSESFNLLVGVRVAWFSVYLSWVFYLPLALVGLDLALVLAARGVIAVYQFVLHTRWVGRLGPLEWLFMTPSHHRVHHGTDDGYVDRNFAAMFIVWDRWFGTFTPEAHEPRYGVLPRFTSTNPIWANLAEWVRIGRLSAAAPRWRDKLAVWFRRPSWEPPVEPVEADRG